MADMPPANRQEWRLSGHLDRYTGTPDIHRVPTNYTSFPPMSTTTTAVVHKTVTPEKVVVENANPATSWRTTALGVAAAITLVAEELGRSGWPDDLPGWLVLLAKTVIPSLFGLVARDKRVSSEGKEIRVTSETHARA